MKNSFTVELAEGTRKLRHLFLFNDVLVCAKYKASGKGEKFTFQLKWYIPLCEVSKFSILEVAVYIFLLCARHLDAKQPQVGSLTTSNCQ